MLLLSATSLLCLGVNAQSVAPTPPAYAGSLAADQAPPSPALSPPAPMPPSQPVGIDIPDIDVHAPVSPLGLNPDGTIAVQAPGPLYDTAGWYRYSPTPGEVGPAVIDGHLDSAHDGPAVFFRLGELRPGQQIDVHRADGSTAVFTITAVAAYTKYAFPTSAVYGNLDHPGLRLITCGGPIEAATGHYRDNTVVFATLTNALTP